MSKKDIAAKDFLSDNKRFADLCNYYLFDGRQVIAPEDLQPEDTTEIIPALGIADNALNIQKWRDIIKSAIIKRTADCTYVIIGVENQTEIHYAMPVRNMLYDALNYSRQTNESAKQHNKVHDYRNSAEFLSGFAKNDTLTPVITITLYWGDDEWNAPRSLHDMFTQGTEAIHKFAANYSLNLIAPCEITDFNKFKTSLGMVLEAIKYSSNEYDMGQLLTNNPAFKNIDIEAANTINTFTNLNLKINQKEATVNMCKAWEDHRQSGINEGSATKLIKQTLKKITKKYTVEQTAEMLEESPETIQKIYDIAARMAPDYDIEKIYHELTMN